MDDNQIIYKSTSATITTLSGAKIRCPDNTEANIVNILGQMPRSGKAVRIDKHALDLPKQSILDHVYHLAFVADEIINTLDLDISRTIISDMFTFHDLAEFIIGDIPDFTEQAKNFQKEPGDIHLQEKNANKLIANSLKPALLERFNTALEGISNGTEEAKIFEFIDKVEPIISVWRYIYFYKNNIKIDNFIDAMSDFFTNPKVGKFSFNEDTDKLVQYLQNKNNARQYYQNGDIAPKVGRFYETNIRKCIEGRKMKLITEKMIFPSSLDLRSSL